MFRRIIKKSVGGARKLIVGQQDLLALAQQGDERAIATLINSAAQKKGVTATVNRQGSCLQIVLESAKVPHQPSCIRFIYDGLLRLEAPSIESVVVCGRQSDQNACAWTEELDLRELADSTQAATPYNSPVLSWGAGEYAPAHQPKFEQTKLGRRIALILLGSCLWVLIATGSYIVSSQLNSQVATNSKKPLRRSNSSPSPTAEFSQKGQVAPATSITIKAVGDMVPGTKHSRNRRSSSQNNILFGNVKPYLEGADILFGNFESTLTNYSRSSKDTSRPMVHAFRSPPAYAELLKATGFDVLSLANNHSMDFTGVGFADTMKNIEEAGIKYVGKKNQILYLKVKNIPIAFIGFSHLIEHNTIQDLAAAKALVETARKNAKIVVISVHGGAEGTNAMRVRNKEEIFYGENRGNMVLFARTMIDSGADLILGHGPHVVRAIELYKGKLIAYSLGNFLGDGALSTRGSTAYSLILQAQLNSEGDFVSGNIIPVYINSRGIPQLDKQFRSVQMIRALTKSDFPNTPIAIDKSGKIFKQSR